MHEGKVTPFGKENGMLRRKTSKSGSWGRRHLGLLVVLVVTLATSCQTTVARWPSNGLKETADRTVPWKTGKSVFSDYLWLDPPVGSRPLSFQNNVAKISFADRELTFELSGEEIALTDQGKRQLVHPETSKNDRYYNMGILSLKTVTQHRMVQKSRLELTTVSVPKTRSVQKSRSVYDSSRKSFRTEYYTDYEHYTVMESRSVMKYYWEYEPVQIKVLDIPAYTVYSFDLSTGESVLVYRTATGYVFQNAAYGYYTDKAPGFLSDVDVKVIFVDANSNGSYTDPEDRLAFNAWNPLVEGSERKEIRGIMENVWYSEKDLKNERFVSYRVKKDRDEIAITNANAKYVKNTQKGKLTLVGLDKTDRAVSVNGAWYEISGKTFVASIEYGFYNLRIIRTGRLDFSTSFEVNDENRAVQVEVTPTAAAGTFTLKHDFKQFKITATDSSGISATTYNEPTMSLVPGSYTVAIAGDGLSVEEQVDIQAGQTWEYDFGTDTLTKKDAS